MQSARPVEGLFRSLRWRVTTVLLAVLFAIPWLRIGGEPVVLLDIAARRFHFGPVVIFPQELYFLWLLIVGLAIALFFFTAIAGRLWCGWACPQTVFTDVFAAIARRVEGWHGHARPKRVAPWRVLLVHAIWLALSAVIAFHLTGYFRSPYVMLQEIRSGELTALTLGLWGFVTALCYADFAWVQQAFCKFLCPYARFQGVMFDRDTLVVAYHEGRGEPRGKRGGEAAGDCVDCGLCVQVCPTDIDIREGLQLECIACTQCIDVCDEVMDKVGREPSLIGYRSLASLEGVAPTHLLRPRVVLYGALLVAIAIAFSGLLAARKTVDLQVAHNQASLYQTASDGRTGNAYTLHIQNRDARERRFHLRLDPAGDFELVAGINPVSIPGRAESLASVFVLAAPDAAIGVEGREIEFVVEPVESAGDTAARDRVSRKARFLARRPS